MKSQKILTKSQSLLRFVVRNDKFQVKEFLKQKLELTPKELGRILWYSEQLGHLEIATLLIKVGADLSVTNPFDKSDPSFLQDLVTRKESRYHQLAVLMLKQGADVNVHTQAGNILDDAILNNNRSIVLIEELIKRGVCVKGLMYKVVCDRSGEIHVLIEQLLDRDTPMVKEKLKRATEEMFHFGSLGDNWQSVLNRIRSANLHLEDRSLRINEIRNYESVFQAAISKNLYELVELLIKYGSDVNKPTESGQFPLHAASKLRQSEIIELLIRSGAKLHSRSNGRSALHAACEYNSIQNIRVLLRHGLDINLIDSNGETPFSLTHSVIVINDSQYLIIKLLAVFVSQGKKINNCDLERIESNVKMHEYYMLCYSELIRMKNIKIMKKFSLLSILDADIGKLLFASRRYNFVKEWNTKQLKEEFPIFHEELEFALNNFIKQKKLLNEKDNAVYESLKDVLTDLPLENILYYFYIDNSEYTC